MRTFLGFASSILFVAVFAPWAVERGIVGYSPFFLIGTIPVVSFFSILTVVPLYTMLRNTQRASVTNILFIAFISGFFSFMGLEGLRFSGGETLSPLDWSQLLHQCVLMGLVAIIGALIFIAIVPSQDNR